jgi:biotin carboxyl carrier protein
MTDRIAVTIGRHARQVTPAARGSGEGALQIDGREETWETVVLSSGRTRVVSANGRVVTFVPLGNGQFLEARTRRIVRVERARPGRGDTTDAGGSTTELRAPMPGRIVRILAQVGAAVVAGAGIVVIEAMKMENELAAPRSGTIRSVAVLAGDTVERDELLVEIE